MHLMINSCLSLPPQIGYLVLELENERKNLSNTRLMTRETIASICFEMNVQIDVCTFSISWLTTGSGVVVSPGTSIGCVCRSINGCDCEAGFTLPDSLYLAVYDTALRILLKAERDEELLEKWLLQ